MNHQQQQPQIKQEVSTTIKNEPNDRLGTSSPTPNNSGWQDIPLKSCTQEDIKDIRFHIMKFATKQDVNIVEDFNKPVRLHRKDPRNIQFHLTREEIEIRKREQEQAKLERERLKAEIKEEDGVQDGDAIDKKEVKEVADPSKIAPDGKKIINKNQADMSQVAPDGGARKQKKNLFKRKTRQINLMDDAKRKLRYEEHYPWVIEDYTGKNVFVGNYEGGSSESQHVLFVFDKDGFKMIPTEKVYRFTPRNKYATLTLEEAEAKMEKNSSVPRWLMKHMEDRSNSESTPDQRFRNNVLVNGQVVHASGSSSGLGGSRPGGRRGLRTVMGGASGSNDRDSDHDDLDYDEEFADDEEAPIMDGDEEENKLSEKKIKREMLKAAHFDGQPDAENDDDIDDLFESEKTRKVDKEGKKLRKVLNKREGGVYDSDDEEDGLLPYLSKSDLESGEESDEEVEVKKEPTDNNGIKQENETTNIHHVRAFVANNVGDGFVVIKAPPSFLQTLPLGYWNPQARKRQSPDVIVSTSPSKKVKLESSLKIKIKKEPSLSPPPISPTPGSPVGSPTNMAAPSVTAPAMDLNSAGPDGVLVTVNDVLDIVRNNPLTTKELLVGLKSRVSAHKDNKQRIISIVKQNLKLVDGKLVLKE